LPRADTTTKDNQFLPFTGVDIPFLRNRPQFIREEQHAEPIHEGYGAPSTGFKPNKITNGEVFNRIVYDSNFGSHSAVVNSNS